MPRVKSKSSSASGPDTRPFEFATRFNDELLPAAKDFSWAVAVRVSGSGWLELYPHQTVASALVRAEDWLRRGPPTRQSPPDYPDTSPDTFVFPEGS